MSAKHLLAHLLYGLLLSAPLTPAADTASLPHVIFIAGKPSHGYGQHEANAGGELLARELNASGLVRVTLHRNGWPAAGISPDTASVVLYMDGDQQHEVLAHLDEMSALMAGGVGLVAIHYATHVPEAAGEQYFSQWLGGYYHSAESTNPIWNAELEADREHPVGRGVEPFSARDEFYFNIRFSLQPAPQAILLATPPDAAREHVPHPRRFLHVVGGTPPPQVLQHKGRRETIAWVLQRQDGGRSFGFTGGHYHWNWGGENYRRLVLNGIAWTAGADIPQTGIATHPLALQELTRGLDSNPPWWFSAADTAATFGLQAR